MTSEPLLSPRTLPAQTWARWANISLGVWLVLSALLWEHTRLSMANTGLVGLSIALTAALATVMVPMRLVNSALAIWLLVSTLLIDHLHPATAWHNSVIAVVVFALSLLTPGRASEQAPRNAAR